MHYQEMDSTTRARRILDTCDRLDLGGLASELGRAEGAYATATGASSGEQERMELLEAIAVQMRQALARLPLENGSGDCAVTCLRLLEHLATSGAEPIYSI